MGPAGQSEKSRERLPVLFGLNKLSRNRNKIDKKVVSDKCIRGAFQYGNVPKQNKESVPKQNQESLLFGP